MPQIVYTVDNFMLHSIDGYLSIHAGSMSEKPGDAANRREVQGLLGEVERTLLIRCRDKLHIYSFCFQAIAYRTCLPKLLYLL